MRSPTPTGSRSVWSQRGAVGVGALLSIMAVVSGLLVGSGNASRLLDLGDGRGWITDNSAGGASGVSGVSVGSATTDWRSVGGGTVASVVAGADGLVWAQVDVGGGQFEWRRVGKDEAMAVSQRGGKDSQVVVSGGGVSWLVDAARSTVRLLTSGGSSKSRAVEPSIRSNRGPGGVAPVAGVDGEGRLVVVTVSSVVVFGRSGDAFKELGRFDVPDRVSNVVTVGERVVLVSRTAGSALVLDGVRPGKRLSLGVSGKEAKVPGRSTGSVLWVLDPTSGRVLGTHIDGRRVGELPLPDTGDATWSDPVVVGDVVMVSAQVGSAVRLWRGAPGAGFNEVGLGVLGDIGSCAARCPELFESGGRLWVNQSTAPDVGVVDTAGVVRRISKGRPSATGEGEGSGAGAAPDQGAKVTDTAFERADVPPVPYRKPPVNAPLGSGQGPGANPTNPTTGQAGDPASKSRTNPTPDTINSIGGAPPDATDVPPDDTTPDDTTPGNDTVADAPTPCVDAPSVTGDQSKAPGSPTGLVVEGSEALDGKGTLQVRWTAPSGSVTCGYRIEISGPMSRSVEAAAVSTSESIGDLPAGHYSVAVRAVNNAGSSRLVTAEAWIRMPPRDPTPGATQVGVGDCRAEYRTLEQEGALRFRALTDGCSRIRARVNWLGRVGSHTAIGMSGWCVATWRGADVAFSIVDWGVDTGGHTSCAWLDDVMPDGAGSDDSGEGWIVLWDSRMLGTPRLPCLVTTAVGDSSDSFWRSGDPHQFTMWGSGFETDPCARPGLRDLTGDGKISCADAIAVSGAIGSTGSGLLADLNGDEIVDWRDAGIIIANVTPLDGEGRCGGVMTP